MKKLFSPDQFTPTEFHTKEDKAKFANHFIRFMESGFRRSLFTHGFYTELSNTFGHIAHYDINGFYSTFFEDPKDWTSFLDCTLDYPCYGDPGWTYSDVERAIQDYLRAHPELLALIEQKSHNSERNQDLEEIRRLAGKHGIKINV